MPTEIARIIENSIALKTKVLCDDIILQNVKNAVDIIVNCFTNGGKVFFCGNGGSAADSQHLASEFSGKFYLDRKPLNAEALHVNSSYLTATANDYSFDVVYARALEAKGNKGDVLICLTTSGESKNILKALEMAKEKEIFTICILGNNTSKVKNKSDIIISIPSVDTPRIQEVQMLLGHIICEQVEKQLFS